MAQPMLATDSVRNHGAYYARNYGAYYRTRAAVLCFGGWGLQTMLNLWPRIRLIQEEREVLGIDRELPNLDRLTAFAAILPETYPASGMQPVPPFHVLRPNPERYPAPFYLPRWLASIEAEVAQAPVSGLTHAEQVGARLVQRVRDDGYVQPLAVSFPETSERGSGRPPVSRAETFGAGIGAAGATVRALLSQVIDPTRLDSLQTRDPFVQTTIYVIAPLYEPRASALVWPVVSELVGALRRRHVSRVIAFFSTASFAPGDGRAVEEATVHMSLRELEALADPRGRDDGPDGFSRLIVRSGGTAWAERLGRRLFDMTYLIDREKSNQALAESAHELAVLVGNAIEAFLVADGLGHLEKSLGPEMLTGRPSYSVLGAASDHIPLPAYIASAIEEEQKQAIRSTVLVADQSASVAADLHMLGATPEALIRHFLGSSRKPMFELAANQPGSGWPPELRVARRYILPKALVNELRKTKDPLRWRELLDNREAAAEEEVKGTQAASRDAAGPISRAAELAAGQVVADLCSAPNGILAARARLAGWLGAVGSLLDDLQRKTGDRRGGELRQAKLDAWQREYASIAETYQQTVTLRMRILMLACLAAFVLAGAILLPRVSELGREGSIALLMGLAVLLPALGTAAWFAITGRMRRLKRTRIDLLEEALSWEASQMLCRSLFDAYSQLYEELRGLQAAIESGVKELVDWTRAQPAVQDLVSEAGEVPIRAMLADEGLWEGVRKHVRRESADGERSRTRFQQLWRVEGDASRAWLPQAKLAARLTAALDGRRQVQGDAPSVSTSTGHSIAELFREYARRSAQYLCPTHRLLADHPALVEEVISSSGVERLLLSDQRQGPAGVGEHSGTEVVEDICVRAKPAADFEITYLLSSDVLEVEFGVAAEGSASPLQRAFEQRGLPLLASKDPLTLSVVRTVNRLSPSELVLTERCRDEYVRLSRGDRATLSLLSPDESREAAALYGEWDEPVTLERQAAAAVARR